MVGKNIYAIIFMTRAQEIKQYGLSPWVPETRQTRLTKKQDIFPCLVSLPGEEGTGEGPRAHGK